MKSCFNHIHDALLQFLLVLTQSLQITRFYGRKSEFRNVLAIMFRCVCVLPSPRSYTVETSHWTSSNMDSVPLQSSSRLWDLDFQNEMQNVLSSEKRTLDHWATVQFFFSTAQVRRFWRCLWFRSGLVALFLKTSERGDSWCTDSSFSSLLVKLSQVFQSALLDCISSLRSSLLLVHLFLPKFFLPVNFAFNMLWYSTL